MKSVLAVLLLCIAAGQAQYAPTTCSPPPCAVVAPGQAGGFTPQTSSPSQPQFAPVVQGAPSGPVPQGSGAAAAAANNNAPANGNANAAAGSQDACVECLHPTGRLATDVLRGGNGCMNCKDAFSKQGLQRQADEMADINAQLSSNGQLPPGVAEQWKEKLAQKASALRGLPTPVGRIAGAGKTRGPVWGIPRGAELMTLKPADMMPEGGLVVAKKANPTPEGHLPYVAAFGEAPRTDFTDDQVDQIARMVLKGALQSKGCGKDEYCDLELIKDCKYGCEHNVVNVMDEKRKQKEENSFH